MKGAQNAQKRKETVSEPAMNQTNDSDPEFDFRHFLRDTLILLGCRKDIADILEESKDRSITSADVEAVRNYTASLMEGLKDRMHHTHKMKLTLPPKP